MTHSNQSTDLHDAVLLLPGNGFECMANAMPILFNDAMKMERTE